MKTGKKILSLVLAIVMIVCAVPMAVAESNQEVTFAGGDGTTENPYQISTPEQLNEVRNNLSAHYIQINDIDMSSWGNWEAIGTGATLYSSTGILEKPEAKDEPFTGTYDGGNYRIKGLKIYDNNVSFANDCFGLFGSVSKATLKNINLINIVYKIDKTTTDYVELWNKYGSTFSLHLGGVAGQMKNSTINNCNVTGSITVEHCSNAHVGGIVGTGENASGGGSVSKCTNKASISVNADKSSRFTKDSSVFCGGIVGYGLSTSENVNYGKIDVIAGDFAHVGGICGEHGTVRNCLNFADISGETISMNSVYGYGGKCNVGGIVGTTYYYVNYCVNYGNIYAKSYSSGGYAWAGGIVGCNGYYGGIINSCININEFVNSIWIDQNNITYSNAGRIAGYGATTNCCSSNETLVNDSLVYGIDSYKNGASCDRWQLMDESTYKDFDFTNIWKIDYNRGGAVLKKSDIYNLGEETYSFNNFSDIHSGGYCFGMSSTSSGYYTGSLDIGIVGGNSADGAYSFTRNETVEAPIRFYQDRQGSIANRAIVAGGTHYKYAPFSDIDKDWEEVVDYVKNHKYDDMGTLQIGYRFFTGLGTGFKYLGHSVNFLRYSDTDGVEKLYIYDNNCPHQETYLYQASDGKIYVAQVICDEGCVTASGPIDCIALRDINKYFSIVGEFREENVINGNEDTIYIEGVTPYLMDGDYNDAFSYMYEFPEYTTTVKITPLVDNATFRYMSEEYNFGKIDEDTYAEFTLSTSEDDVPEFEIVNAPEDEPETPDEPEVPETPDTPDDSCSCNCHAGGIKAFFFKLFNFFAKLFNPAKRVCACGVKH